MNKLAILVDYREKPSGIPDLLLAEGIPVSYENLAVGDYQIGELVIERKEIHDFVNSKTSGHLDRQLFDMSRQCPFSYLFIHADPNKHPESPTITSALMELKFMRSSYFGSRLSASLRIAPEGQQGRTAVEVYDNVKDMICGFLYLYEKITTEDTIRFPKFVRKGISPDEQLIYILTSFPGIGKVRAMNILNTPSLNSFQKIANATVEDFAVVPKLPRKVAEDIVALLHLPFDNTHLDMREEP